MTKVAFVLAVVAFALAVIYTASARPMPGPTTYHTRHAPAYLDRHK